MSQSLMTALTIQPPAELIQFLDDTPLVYGEKIEDYYRVFCAIAVAAGPKDAFDWLDIKCIVDLVWEHQRELFAKAGMIKLAQREVVLDLLMKTSDDPTSQLSYSDRSISAAEDAERWVCDPAAKREIDAKLLARGYSEQEILAKALIRSVDKIDAIDRRIASFEGRRIMILREIDRRKARLARSLDAGSSAILDAEYEEAAE